MDNDRKREVLEKIRQAHGGQLTPEMVVSEASVPTHPFHDLFPWDDRAVAHAHRLSMARALIASTEVTFTANSHLVVTVAYVRDPEAARNVQGYVSVEESAHKPLGSTILLNESTGIEALVRRSIKLARALDPPIAIDYEKLLKSLKLIQSKITRVKGKRSREKKVTV